MAAIAATLAHYSETIITSVTHPVTGLPSQKSWLPTVKEVHDACEELDQRERSIVAREKRIHEQLAARAQEDSQRADRPTYEQMKAKYGENWGLGPVPSDNAALRAAENRRAVERATARVMAEYLHLGMESPRSALALSPSTLKTILDVDAERNRSLAVDQAAE